MLPSLTSQLIIIFQSHLALLIFLFDFMLKSLLLVAIARYYANATSPFFSNTQKRHLWLTVFLLLVMLPIVALVNHIMPSDYHVVPNLKLITLLVPSEIVDGSLSRNYYTGGIIKYLLALYAIGLLLLLLRLSRSLSQIYIIHRHADFDAPPEATQRLNRLRDLLGVPQSVRIATYEICSSPMTYGTLKPTIILPSSSYYADIALLENVLVHELGHIRRRDHITYIACYLAAALNWFNPFIWIALKQLSLESEYACDNEVLKHCNRPIEFAGQLLNIARCNLDRGHNTLASRSIITRGELSLRIENILNHNLLPHEGKLHASAFPIAMLCLLFLLTTTGKIFALGNEQEFASEELRLIYSEIPEYPDAALKKGTTGFAQFSFSVDALAGSSRRALCYEIGAQLLVRETVARGVRVVSCSLLVRSTEDGSPRLTFTTPSSSKFICNC